MIIPTLFLLTLCLTISEAHKTKPKPKPKPGHRNGIDDDYSYSNMTNITDDTASDDGPLCPFIPGEGYCGALNYTTGQGCGNYGIYDYSYCAADTAGTPYCFAFSWCDSAVKPCNCTSDCGEFEACLLSCWPYPVCAPLCGNPALPLAPSFNDAPYYNLDTPSDTCLNESDTGLSIDISLREINFDRDSTYSTYMARLHSSSTSETSLFSSLMTPLNLTLAFAAILMAILVSLRQFNSAPVATEPRFTALPISSEHLGDLELEQKISSKLEPVLL
jgi:hypothetical protein